jgi:hypothetical protein
MLLVPEIGVQLMAPPTDAGGSARVVVVDVPPVSFTGLPGIHVIEPLALRMGALMGVVVVVVVMVITYTFPAASMQGTGTAVRSPGEGAAGVLPDEVGVVGGVVPDDVPPPGAPQTATPGGVGAGGDVSASAAAGSAAMDAPIVIATAAHFRGAVIDLLLLRSRGARRRVDCHATVTSAPTPCLLGLVSRGP